MMNTTQDTAALRRNARRGLLRMDFQRHREGFLIGLPSIVLVSLAIGLVENAGGPMFFWMGLAMGAGCGVGFGRGESLQGVEEYSFGLPPTRQDRYTVRFLLGIAFLAVVYFLGLAAGPLGWVRALGELLPIELAEYQPEAAIWEGFRGTGFYVLSIGLSLAVFAESYAVSINVEHSDDTTWVLRLLPFCVAAAATIALDYHFLSGSVGYLSGAIGLAYFVPRAYLGMRRFERRDVVLEGGGTEEGRPQGSRVLVIILALTVLLTFGVWAYLTQR